MVKRGVIWQYDMSIHIYTYIYNKKSGIKHQVQEANVECIDSIVSGMLPPGNDYSSSPKPHIERWVTSQVYGRHTEIRVGRDAVLITEFSGYHRHNTWIDLLCCSPYPENIDRLGKRSSGLRKTFQWRFPDVESFRTPSSLPRQPPPLSATRQDCRTKS